ncbi:MAG: hypothetical protein WDO73_02725 [Ignavibacteriota bacterium]
MGDTVHVVGIPTAEQMLLHERQSTKTTEGRRNQEIRGYLEPSGELYDKIVKSAEGYVIQRPGDQVGAVSHRPQGVRRHRCWRSSPRKTMISSRNRRPWTMAGGARAPLPHSLSAA